MTLVLPWETLSQVIALHSFAARLEYPPQNQREFADFKVADSAAPMFSLGMVLSIYKPEHMQNSIFLLV